MNEKKLPAGAREIRAAVSDAYAEAVTKTSSCCGSDAPKGFAAKLAGYSREELTALPPEAVANSFGCGNPLAFSEVALGDAVLDLGSGAGIDLLIAAKMTGPAGRVIGVDMTPAMLAKARENARAAGLGNIEIREGIIEKLPVEDASVDWVISNCVINLSPEKDRVFAEIARVLKSGGRMLVSDIVAEDLPEDVKQHAGLYSSCLAGAISERDYCEGLRRAGLADVEVRERLVYDEFQLAYFVVSELDTSGCGCGCQNGITQEQLDRWLPQLEGKIWSAKIFARKP